MPATAQASSVKPVRVNSPIQFSGPDAGSLKERNVVERPLAKPADKFRGPD